MNSITRASIEEWLKRYLEFRSKVDARYNSEQDVYAHFRNVQFEVDGSYTLLHDIGYILTHMMADQMEQVHEC